MFDLMHLAFQGNLTRVTSFMMARELSTLSYPQIGVADGHHPVSHNNNIPEQVAKKIKIDIYHLDLFSQFLDKLQVDAGWRRQPARPLAVPLWQRHDQRQRSTITRTCRRCSSAVVPARIRGIVTSGWPRARRSRT